MAMTNRIPAGLLTATKAVYTRLLSLGDSSTPLLSFIPKPIKLALLLILLFNSPSWPFLWHLRVWYTPLKAYLHVYTKGRKGYLDEWIRVNKAAGGVGGVTTRLKRVAWVDDCDYNLHLSNSSYAKALDATRMDWCIEATSPLFTPGAHAALGAAHYVFFKEIPLGSSYVMETKCGGWGEKWFYLVTEFIIYPPKKSHKSKSSPSSSTSTSTSSSTKTETKPPTIPALSTSFSTSTSTSTSASGSSTPSNGEPSFPTQVEEIKKQASVKARAPRSDGGVVCCLAVSEYCFKMGRVTIPPRIALYISLQSPTPTSRAHARTIVESKDFGRKWLSSGWKGEPNADELGKDIGLDGGWGGRRAVVSSENGESGAGGERAAEEEADRWIRDGRDNMGKVVEGLSGM